MDGLIVSLTKGGSFEIADGPLMASVGFEPETPSRPWVLSTLLDTGNVAADFEVVAAFGSLDDALIEMINLVCAGRDWIRFKVKLPCGASFIRPGHVPAENVMASLGWVHVKTLIGHMVRAFHSGYSAEEVSDLVADEVYDDDIEVGLLADVGRYDGETFWCIDLKRNCHEFLRYEDISSAVSAAFSGFLGDGQPLYDFLPTYPISKTTAQIFSFEDRAKKAA